jgi:serine/threonine protein kinase
MATVYLAIQENFQREVALKVMSSTLAADADFSERFLREARIVSRLVHPNIVTVHDVGIHQGHHYLSMEYIPGTDLKHNFMQLDGARILRLMKEVAAALDYAGKKGYVHRDVKPENIMISQEDGRAILMDFGIARVADSDNSMTKTGVALGTPYYMSPEQARGKAIDGRSDLYALGVVFYLLIMGKVPYDAESAIAIGIKHISDPVPVLPVAVGKLQPLIDKIMAKDPEHRFQTGAELITALKAIDAKVIDSWKAIGGMESSVVRHDTPVRTSSNKTRRRVPAQANIRSSEALHIPKEDIAIRQKSFDLPEKKQSSVLLLFIALCVVLSGGYYFQFGLSFPPSDQQINRLAQSLGLASGPLASVKQAENKSVINSVRQVPATMEKEILATPITKQELETERVDAELRDLLNQSRVMAATVILQPELTGDLVKLYQAILVKKDNQQEAVAGIEGIKQKQELRFNEQLKNKNYPQAEASLTSLLAWFPELISSKRFQNLQKKFVINRDVQALLLEAKQYVKEKKLSQPARGNAVQSFNKLLVIAPDNQQAMDGLSAISKTYYGWAKSSQTKADFKKALSYADSGLQANKNSKGLQQLRKQLLEQISLKKSIESLLAEAVRFKQQEKLFDPEGSAAQRYLAVLSLQPANEVAIKGIQALQNNAMDEAEYLAQDYEFEQAISQLQQALVVFPENEKLGELLLDIELRKPTLTALVLSGEPIDNIEGADGDVIAANRTLHIAFNYQNFFQPTTVMQATLYDGSRAIKIAAVPVVVSGKGGTVNFRIDRPVEAFTEGGYHIDIMMNGRLIKTRSFSVTH